MKAALASGELAVPRYESWLKLQRELRAIAIRSDARLRREEKRKWHAPRPRCAHPHAASLN